MKFFCSFFALLIAMYASAQIKFETGYFIDNGGQKTECLIRNVDWQNNPTGFDYKTSETSEVKKASLENVKRFEVGDFSFERWTVDIDRSTAALSDMTHDRNPAFKKETLFLRLIFDSPVKLFQYGDSNVSRYFFSSADAVPEQLVFKEYKVNESQVAQNNLFRQQLFNRLKDRNISERNVAGLSYTKRDLLSLFRKAYPATEKSEKNPNSGKSEINFKVFAGVAFAKIESKNVFDPFFDELDESKVAPVAGVEIEAVLPFNRGRWTLFADPSFSTLKVSKTGNVRTDIDYTFIGIPVGVRYNSFLSERTKLFVNAGISINVALSSSLKIKSQYNFPQTDFAMRSMAFGTFAGLGVSVDRFSVEARYDIPRKLLKNSDSWDAKYSGISVLGAYRFN